MDLIKDLAGNGYVWLAMTFLPMMFPKIRNAAKEAWGKMVVKFLYGFAQPDLKKMTPAQRAQYARMALEVMKFAEIMLPDKGMGAKKKKIVTGILEKSMPGTAAKFISDVIDDLWVCTDKSMDTVIAALEKKAIDS